MAEGRPGTKLKWFQGNLLALWNTKRNQEKKMVVSDSYILKQAEGEKNIWLPQDLSIPFGYFSSKFWRRRRFFSDLFGFPNHVTLPKDKTESIIFCGRESWKLLISLKNVQSLMNLFAGDIKVRFRCWGAHPVIGGAPPSQHQPLLVTVGGCERGSPYYLCLIHI